MENHTENLTGTGNLSAVRAKQYRELRKQCEQASKDWARSMAALYMATDENRTEARIKEEQARINLESLKNQYRALVAVRHE